MAESRWTPERLKALRERMRTCGLNTTGANCSR